MSDVEMQRQLARIALEAAGADAGFALAGSGAIREHGFIERPTQDVDLFTVRQDATQFRGALERVEGAFREHGFSVARIRDFDGFARLMVSASDGRVTEVDLGVDWRANAPVQLSVGAVLSQDDAVGNKVAALFSRAEARDYLDVDAIRRSGRYSDAQLLELAATADGGFDLDWFAKSLRDARRIHPDEVAPYGCSPRDLEGAQQRLGEWAARIESRGRGVVDGEPRVVLDSLNPTGSVFAGYDPASRMDAQLGPDMTTFAVTHGLSDDAQIQIYRGIPPGFDGGIVPGDFVTTERQLAADYAGTGRVVSRTVSAGDVLDSLSEPDGGEYIYRPGAAKELSQPNVAGDELSGQVQPVTAEALRQRLQDAAATRPTPPQPPKPGRSIGPQR